MKILHMIDIPWDSGLANYALVLAQGLKRQGHTVFVSAVPGQKPWTKARRLGLRTVPLVTVKGLAALRRFVKKHGIELINAHTGRTHSLAVAAALGQGVAVVRTRSDARAVRRRPGGRFLYRHTPRVVAAADYIREAIVRDLRLPPKQAVTVHQGIAWQAFAAPPPPKEPVLGIVARLDPVKGHRYLLEAVSLLRSTYPALRLRIIGQDENVKQRDLLTIAERLRVEDRIEFLGYQADVPKLMEQCAIGVIASTGSEAVSRVALEWMAAGRPVAATRVGCLPEIVQEGVTGFLADPRSAPSLASAIAKLLHEPSRAAAMGQAGRKRLRERFSLDGFIEKSLDVYKAAIRASRETDERRA